jgi:PAS domain S-box-containing protein
MAATLRILYIDEDAGDRDLVQRELTRAFLRVRLEWVSDADAQSRALEAGDFDVVVTDFVLGWTNGLSILREVKARHPDCPVIMFTAGGNEAVAVEGMKAGLDDYVTRSPAHRARLATAIQAALDRSRARAAAREAEAKYRHLYAGVPVGLFRVAPDGGLLDANPAFLQMLGFAPDASVLGLPMDAFFVDPAELSRLSAGLARDGVVRGFESSLRRRDGAVIEVRGSIRAMRAGEGPAPFWEGELEDITARRQAEESLRASEAELRSLVAAMTDVIILFDADGRYRKIVTSNPAHLVRPASEMLGKTLREVFPRERADAFLGDIREVLRTRQPLSREICLPFAEEERWVLATLSPAGEGNVLLVARDITDRRRAEQSLRESEEKYRTLIETASDAILLADAGSGQILVANRKASELLGLPIDRIVGSSQESLYPPDEVDRARRQFAEAARIGTATVSDLSLRGAGGRRIPVEISTSSVEIGGRRVLQGIYRDVSERRQLEEQLRQTQKIEAIGRLAGGVAHDFNNLLSAIIGFGQLARQQAGVGSAVHRYLEEVLRAADRAAALTRQLLAFSRRQVLRPVLLDLGVVVKGMGEMVRRLQGEDITLRVKTPAGPSWIKADIGQMEQVVLNLAVNARDAMPRGGTLTLETGCVTLDAAAAGRLPSGRPGDFVVLSVRDTGCGMDAETRAHIFEPFFTTKEHGTGLGLSTVYGIVRQSGGFVDVESEPGRGTVFHVYLPRAEPPATRPSSGTFTAMPPEGHETLLLVEDEEVVRSVAREILQGCGYTVLEAGNADEALAAAAAHGGPLHLLLSDVGLPGLSGPMLARRMADLRPGLRFLFMTGYTDEKLGEDAIVIGGQLLRKPFTQATLARCVREALDAPSPEVS